MTRGPLHDGPLVAVDWGTSAFRATLVDRDGAALDRHASGRGIQFVEAGRFEEVLLEAVGGWLAGHGPLAILASGMIGSRNGWVETPYVDCPAGTAALAAGTVAHGLSDGSRILFVPGLRDPSARPFPDVMRGEETQVAGFGLDREGVVVLPGTHSKWVRVEGGRIAGFQSFVSGELYELIAARSFIARFAKPAPVPQWRAFDLGARAAASGEAAPLLSALFGARTGVLAGALAETEVLDYASGVIVGQEFRQARDCGWFAHGDRIGLVANDALAARYARAAALFGLAVEPAPEDAATRGVLAIWRALLAAGSP